MKWHQIAERQAQGKDSDDDYVTKVYYNPYIIKCNSPSALLKLFRVRFGEIQVKLPN